MRNYSPDILNKLNKTESKISISENVINQNMNYINNIKDYNWKSKKSILFSAIVLIMFVGILYYTYIKFYNLELFKNNILINLIILLKKFFYWINNLYLITFFKINKKNFQYYINNEFLFTFVNKMKFELFFRYKLMVIWVKYTFNLCFSTSKYFMKKYSRKYKIILVFQILIYKLINKLCVKTLNIKNKTHQFIFESSNINFFFFLAGFLILLIILWENVLMNDYITDSKTNNLKITTSTISTVITVFYLPNIKLFCSNIINKYSNYFYNFCSRSQLKLDKKITYEFNNLNLNEFNTISKNWWRSRKIDSIFKGAEIINEIKKRSQLEQNYINLNSSLDLFDFISKIRHNGYFSKELCNLIINGNKKLKIIIRFIIILSSTLTILLILFNEKKKFKLNKKLKSYSKKYTFITVVSAVLLPLFLNNIQKLNNYGSDQGKIISILFFLGIRMVTNQIYFSSLIIGFINYFKSKFANSNNKNLDSKSQISSNVDNKHNSDEKENIKEKEKVKEKLLEVKESSSLHKERSKKASLLLKSNINSSKLNNKQLSNYKGQKNKDISRNKINTLNEAIRNKITSTKFMQNKLSNNEEVKLYNNLYNLVTKIIYIPKNIIICLLNFIKKIFIQKLFGLILYLYSQKYRGKILSSFDHYKLDNYMKNSKIPINLIEELLKSMTLCYSNIGNPLLIRSINISKTELINEFEYLKSVLPDQETLQKLNSFNDLSQLSQIEIIFKSFSGIISLQNKINVEIQYYMILNSLQTLSNCCEIIKASCEAIINSESLIELINNITNNDIEKITLLLNSKMDYITISNIMKDVILTNQNKSNILVKYSLIMNSFNKVNVELVETLIKLKYIDTKDIFTQWNILRNGLKYLLNEIKNNRKSYEGIYMGGLPLHTMQMSLHHLNTMAKKTSDLVQESIISCGEFCLYFKLKTIEEIYEWNNTSEGQLKLFNLCKSDCIDILNLIQTIRDILKDICDNKLRIEGKEIDISYLSNILSPISLNSEHKCCRKESESNCKLHGKGLQDTFKLYSEGNYPAVVEISDNKDHKKFVPERPRSSIPRESSSNRDMKNNKNNKSSINNQNELSYSHNNSKIPISNIKFDNNTSDKNEDLPFLLSTPDEPNSKNEKKIDLN